MKNYHKIKLKELLQYIDPLNTSFMDNQQIINMDMIQDNLNNSILFLDDEENIIKQQEFHHETLFWLKQIIFQIHNPQFLHDGNIKLHMHDTKPYLNNACVICGIEKIISAIYHNEEFIIVQIIGNLPHTFSDVESYDNINQIDYSFTQIPFPDGARDIDFNINYSDSLDLHYISARLNKKLIIDWHDKDMIMRNVQSNKINLDYIKNNMPEELLQDIDFIVQLIFSNTYVAYWFDQYDATTFAICEKLYDINTKQSIDMLTQLLSYYWKEYYSVECYCSEIKYSRFHDEYIDSYNIEKKQLLNQYLFSNKKLIDFMLNNEQFHKELNFSIIEIVALLPIDLLNDQKLRTGILRNVPIIMLEKLPSNIFHNKDDLLHIFTAFSQYAYFKTEYTQFKDFFINNIYAHEYWYDNKDIMNYILSNLPKPKDAYNPVIKSIYACLSENLQSDNDIIIKMLALCDNIIYILPENKIYDPVIMNWYMTHGKLRNTHSSYNEDKKIYSNQDFYTQTCPDTIKHICDNLPGILFENDAPQSWKDNFQLAILHPQYFISNFTKYSQHIQETIINNDELLNEWINRFPNLYEGLPLHLQENEKLALIYAKDKPYKPTYAMKLLLNMKFCYALTEINVHNIKYVPPIIKNNIYFTICFFGILFNGKHYPNTIENMKPYYEELFALFEHFEIKVNDYYNFILEHFEQQNTYYLHQDLHKMLPLNDKKTGKTKI